MSGFLYAEQSGDLCRAGGNPSIGKLNIHLAHRQSVGMNRINLRVGGPLGMCGIEPALPDTERNIVASTLLVALGGDVQPRFGRIGFVGWLPQTDQLTQLAPRFATTVELMHAEVLSALAGSKTSNGPEWALQVRAIAKHLRTAPRDNKRRPIEDFFGRDRTKVRWWTCPNGISPCRHAGIWHAAEYPHACSIEGCDCIAF